MPNRSEYVKAWRKKQKERIVKAMGSKCQICGYNKCNNALALHHINPEEKEFSFGVAKAGCWAWWKIVDELEKCVLLCCRCHIEIHQGVSELPKSFARFNPEFREYKDPSDEYDECPICDGQKPKFRITCSRQCTAKKQWKANWDSIDLRSLVKSGFSDVKIAEMLGCSSVTVGKRRKRLKLSPATKPQTTLHRNAKLTEEEAHRILQLHATGNHSLRSLGKMFGVNYGTISDLVNRETWKWLA